MIHDNNTHTSMAKPFSLFYLFFGFVIRWCFKPTLDSQRAFQARISACSDTGWEIQAEGSVNENQGGGTQEYYQLRRQGLPNLAAAENYINVPKNMGDDEGDQREHRSMPQTTPSRIRKGRL